MSSYVNGAVRWCHNFRGRLEYILRGVRYPNINAGNLHFLFDIPSCPDMF